MKVASNESWDPDTSDDLYLNFIINEFDGLYDDLYNDKLKIKLNI